MDKIKTFIKENKISLILSFLIPAFTIVIVYLLFGITWNGKFTNLSGDGYQQYVNGHVLYSNLLHNNKGLFYTFTSGLGLNFKVFSSYYLGSFFMPLTYFFDVSSMPNGMYLLTILKFGTIGLSSFISFKNMYKSVSQWIILAVSICYSLLSFTTSQSEIIMWLDSFILFPLILWGIHELMDRHKKTLYFSSLTILFIQNYYFGFMMAIFLVLYFVARSTFNNSLKETLINFFDFSITSVLSGITALISILPMFLDLKTNGEVLTNSTRLFTEKSWLFDIFSKNFVGSYDSTQYGSVATIYVGIFPLVFAILFFFTKTIKTKTKIAYFLIMMFIVLSFYLDKLDLLWQGMHAPNMFLHRYNFVFSLLIVLMALESIKRIKEINEQSFIVAGAIIFIGYLLVIFSKKYPYVKSINIILSVIFLLSYILLILFGKNKKIPLKFIPIFILLLAIIECSINSYFQINGLKNQWGFASKEQYDNAIKKIKPISDSIKSNTFYRMDAIENDTINDGMKFDYNSIAQFSSIRNRQSSATLDQLGFRSYGTNLKLQYPNNTLIGDGLFSVKYNITNNIQPHKYGFNDTNFENLKENSIISNLAMVVENGYNDINFNGIIPSENQSRFLNSLSNENLQYFNYLPNYNPKFIGDVRIENNKVILHKKENIDEVSVSYEITTPANSQMYIRIPNVIFEGENISKNLTINVGDISYSVFPYDNGEYFNLGYFEEPTNINFKISAENKDNMSFDTPQILALDIKNYHKAISKINENPINVTTTKNGVDMVLILNIVVANLVTCL